jgi:hypothetical protein
MGGGMSWEKRDQQERAVRDRFVANVNRRLRQCLGDRKVRIDITDWTDAEIDQWHGTGDVCHVNFHCGSGDCVATVGLLDHSRSGQVELCSETSPGWRKLGLNQLLRAVAIAFLCHIPRFQNRYNVLSDARNWLSAYVLGRDYVWTPASRVTIDASPGTAFAVEGQLRFRCLEIGQDAFMKGMNVLRQHALSLGATVQPEPPGYQGAVIEIALNTKNFARATDKILLFVGDSTNGRAGALQTSELRTLLHQPSAPPTALPTALP